MSWLGLFSVKCVDFYHIGSKIIGLTCVEARDLSVDQLRVMPFILNRKDVTPKCCYLSGNNTGIGTERADTVMNIYSWCAIAGKEKTTFISPFCSW